MLHLLGHETMGLKPKGTDHTSTKLMTRYIIMFYLVINYCNKSKLPNYSHLKPYVICINHLIYCLCVIATKFFQQSIFKNKKEQKRFSVWCRRWEGDELRLVCTLLTSSRTSAPHQRWRTGHFCWDVSANNDIDNCSKLKDLKIFLDFVSTALY